ncbi:hypothetical protein [Corynebacterium jeikeium]|uniref:hypothetical protein n=1 Tax=Corynebacterium jeikeium TaxID=38289 RepID=UPI000883D13A|nr:hypothetical protein [Corynebacterium jeikeium]SCX11930.1 hypothetical protein CJBVI_0863 [Corynebacterium jeikeium]
MSYQIVFSDAHKSVRRSNDIHLGLKVKNGYLDAYLLRAKYHTGFGFLMGIPLTTNNLSILGVADSGKASTMKKDENEWIIPPFCLQHSFLGKHGAFKRIAKLETKDYAFDPDNTAILGDAEAYDPNTRQFVPKEVLDGTSSSGHAVTLNREKWSIEMFVSGMAVRAASAEERTLPLVPWTVFSLRSLDLWIEQFRCWCLDAPIPTQASTDED